MCKHEWIGDSKGVTCTKCNTFLTIEDFRKMVENKKTEKAEKKGAKKK